MDAHTLCLIGFFRYLQSEASLQSELVSPHHSSSQKQLKWLSKASHRNFYATYQCKADILSLVLTFILKLWISLWDKAAIVQMFTCSNTKRVFAAGSLLTCKMIKLNIITYFWVTLHGCCRSGGFGGFTWWSFNHYWKRHRDRCCGTQRKGLHLSSVLHP